MQENNSVMNTSPSESVYPSVTTPQPVYEKPKTNNFLVILLSVLLFVAVSIAGFFAYQTQVLVNELRVMSDDSKQTAQKTTEPVAEPVATVDPTTNWKTYKNSIYNYQISYPPDWVILDESTGNGPTDTSKVVILEPGKPYTGIRVEYVGMMVDLSKTQKEVVNKIEMYRQDTMHGKNYYVGIFDTDQFLYLTGVDQNTSNVELNNTLRKVFETFTYTD